MRDWLRTLRIEKRMTMKDLAKKLGISESYYCSIENGDRQKKMDIVLASGLSTILEVPLAVIVSYEEQLCE